MFTSHLASTYMLLHYGKNEALHINKRFFRRSIDPVVIGTYFNTVYIQSEQDSFNIPDEGVDL